MTCSMHKSSVQAILFLPEDIYQYQNQDYALILSKHKRNPLTVAHILA